MLSRQVNDDRRTSAEPPCRRDCGKDRWHPGYSIIGPNPQFVDSAAAFVPVNGEGRSYTDRSNAFDM
ncbi:MAG: hypothetical protein D6725_08935 [Planctomycetota bacterium]|nr:MAG: hypothetical protein D6725_08935 [Planctomycetota bacterium]